jgi:PhnB protein
VNTEKKNIRHGFGVVRPFSYGRLDLPDFVKNAFDAVEVERNTITGGFQVQARIGDSIVVMAAMDPPYPAATKASIYIYVDDVDATYARAIAAGGEPTVGPTDRPYQERSATVRDSFGNIWHITTYKG